MLFIFRKLRRSFFLPGKVRTYCAYAFGEIALIMIGILLALQVSDWNQARKDRTVERDILGAIAKELKAGLSDIADSLASLDKKDAALVYLASAFKNGTIENDHLFLSYVATASAYGWGLPLMPNFTFEEQVSTGKMRQIENTILR